MTADLHGLATLAMRSLDPEYAHGLAIKGLKLGLGPRAPADPPILATELAGLRLPNPVGLAPGFDKDAEVFAPMLHAGFGFVECGTVTPLPQVGNPRPRLFRLWQDRAVINRMGFNNQGLEAFAARLAHHRTWRGSARTWARTRMRSTVWPTTPPAFAASGAWRHTSRSTSPRPTRRGCAPCRRRRRSRTCLGA